MIEEHLVTLGNRVAQLRFAKQLKQSELAYEAGVSLRTLQRLEAGEVVRSDVLLKVIDSLGKLDSILAALETAEFSPFEILADAGIRPGQLRDQPTIPLHGERGHEDSGAGKKSGRRKRRVRHSAEAEVTSGKPGSVSPQSVTVLWPEDQ